MSNHSKTLIKDLTTGSVTKLLLQFAFPIMLSNLLQTAYNMADMVIIGRFVGSAGLSSVSVGGDVLHFFMFLGMGFATAGQIVVSQYVGAGRKEELNKVIGTLFSSVFIMGIVLMILSFLLANPLLAVLHAPAEAVEGARDYILCCTAGLIFTLEYNMVSAILRGMGDSKHPMIFVAIGTVINIVLDLLMIAWLHMGAFGAALATVLSQGISLLLSVIYLYRNREAFSFDFRLRSFRPDGQIVGVMIRLGIPIAIQTSASTLSAMFVSSFVNTYGVVASAVTGVGLRLSNLALIVANSMNVSSAAMIGQCYGAGKTDRIRQAFWRVFAVDFVFVTLLSILILLFPEAVFGLFNQDAQVLEMSRLYAPVAAITFMGFAVRSPSLGLINGLGHSRMNFTMGVVEGFILRIGLTYLMGVVLGWGIQGFWYGSAIASYGYGLVVFPYFLSGRWKRRKAFG
ncbi:MAG: MATE family efflux transporter [Firmicutes bacterium]|nr:MATE family efflux transporter [Bacillota bacterium]